VRRPFSAWRADRFRALVEPTSRPLSRRRGTRLHGLTASVRRVRHAPPAAALAAAAASPIAPPQPDTGFSPPGGRSGGGGATGAF